MDPGALIQHRFPDCCTLLSPWIIRLLLFFLKLLLYPMYWFRGGPLILGREIEERVSEHRHLSRWLFHDVAQLLVSTISSPSNILNVPKMTQLIAVFILAFNLSIHRIALNFCGQWGALPSSLRSNSLATRRRLQMFLVVVLKRWETWFGAATQLNPFQLPLLARNSQSAQRHLGLISFHY